MGVSKTRGTTEAMWTAPNRNVFGEATWDFAKVSGGVSGGLTGESEGMWTTLPECPQSNVVEAGLHAKD